MMIKINQILFYLLVSITIITLNAGDKEKYQVSSLIVFNSIERGISSANVSEFSEYFSSQTYISLTGRGRGYYSANQLYYVLEDFFVINKPTTPFRFITIKEEGKNPYGTGVFYYQSRGQRFSARVFVSLKYNGNGWKITQITID